MSMNSPKVERNANWMHQPLAVIGMACRLPGADDLDQFWQLLHSGQHGIGRFPEAFVDRQLYLTDQKGVRGQSYSDVGGLISSRPIDWSLMPIEQARSRQYDPAHLILCEVVARAFREAGYSQPRLKQSRTGVYVGHSSGSTRGGEIAYRTLLSDYVDLLSDLPQWQTLPIDSQRQIAKQLLTTLRKDRPQRDAGGGPTVDASCAASLITEAFDLCGPHMSIDAACASSLVALALGAAALWAGQIDMAVVGGASYNKFDSLILFSQAQSCSANGSSRPFDAAADGLISSEGYVVFVIKTLAQAQADGDPIAAVIRGIGMSSDGRGRSLWAPRKEGQASAIERAYSPGITADSVHMVEAHATSTQVGDATEMEALAGFFKSHLTTGKRIPVGSVKSNIGHTLETAGLAGLLKAILSIKHGTIPSSINVQQPSAAIDWQNIPLYVPRQSEPWPQLPADQPRRAAVNAFGIGGLNVHVIVDQYLASTKFSSNNAANIRVSSSPREPIAIVGRGLVLPGALDIAAFASLLQSGSTQVQTPPTSRWRQLKQPHTTSDRLDVIGGYITDYQYDWRKHKVPPKQIAQANPLQFMLLEAAEQALREAGYLDSSWNKTRTAVVVGSIFGGDFGNALYAGLRLPEFKRALQQLLTRTCTPEGANEIVQEYEKLFLKNYPALLDETGSFTSSTLASRLSKTFDLMGGAMAIDAADASALAALDAATSLLRSGAVDHVLCATGQSSLDRASFERLALSKRLVDRQQYESTPAHARSGLHESIPAEGVALVLLKRLDDARRHGDRILATIHDVAATRNAHVTGTSKPRRKAIEAIGNLQGAQGLVDVIEHSLSSSPESQPVVVSQTATSGLHYTASLQAGAPLPAHTSALQADAKADANIAMTILENSQSLTTSPTLVSSNELPLTILRHSATSADQLAAQLQCLAAAPWDMAVSTSSAWFDPQASWRTAMVVNQADYQHKARLLAAQLGQAGSVVPLSEQGLYWSRSESRGGKVAWLFPGQGSQYPHMLRDLVQSHSIASQALQECNAALAELHQPSFEQIAWQSDSQLGENVWHTQAAMLVADYIVWHVLRSGGFAPDVVAGHSYGELVAMLAAGCWDIKQALKATWHRCRSIMDHAQAACGMLSIQAPSATVEQLIRTSGSLVWISHRNAPQQTVVGGKQSAVAQFAQLVDSEGIACRQLAVPTAFHTSMLINAQSPFAASLQQIPIEPPSTPLLSSVTGQYIADPLNLRQSLVAQLVQPLDYVALVERLIADRVQIAVEVGPQQVLTRLTRQIAGSRLIVLSTDHVKRGCQFQLLSAQAGLETYGATTMSLQSATIQLNTNVVTTEANKIIEPVHFDATAQRRERMRTAAQRSQSPSSPAVTSSIAPVVQFDASQIRRQRNQATSNHSPTHKRGTEDPSPTHKRGTEDLNPTRKQGTEDPNPTHQPATNVDSSTSEQATQSQPLPSAHHAAPAPQATVETFLIDFVVEQTGYPAEIIELDWDIEADLGIDSIKKAQLFGELREFFDLESLTSFSLDSYKTLRDIVQLLVTVPGKGEWLTQPSSQETSKPSQPQSSSLTTVNLATPVEAVETPIVAATPQEASRTDTSSASLPTTPSVNAHQLEQLLIDFVVEQTGYPPEIVELDADLEADLGIDSIKKAQLLGELREMFALSLSSATQDEQSGRVSLSEFRTLRSVKDWLLSVLPFNTTVAPQPPVVQEQPAATLHEFRSLVALPVSEIPLTGPSALPVARFANANERTGGDVTISSNYVPAVLANLQSLAGRPTRAEDEYQVHYNGEREHVHAEATRLGSAVGTVDTSLVALDATILAQAEWRPCSVNSQPGSGDSLIAIAEYHTPNWLTLGGGVPLALHLREHTQGTDLQLTTPGCVHALMHLNTSGLLLGGGQFKQTQRSGDSAHIALHVATWLNQHANQLPTLIEFERAARQLRLAADWWLMGVDLKSAQRVLVECREGVIVIQKSELPPAGPESQSASAHICLDRSNQQLVIRSQLRQAPFVSDEARLPITRHREPIAPSGIPATVTEAPQSLEPTEPNVDRHNSITKRFVLRMAPSPQRPVTGRRPTWSGAALIIGDNPVAIQLEARLRSAQVPVHRWPGSENSQELATKFDEAVKRQTIRHLFLTTPCDPDAQSTLEEAAWQKRRNVGLMSLYWLCQRWHQHVCASGWVDDASLVAVTSLGGEFGLQGKVPSVEGGALSGLLKSILIESWVQGFRTFPIKVIDTCGQDSPAQIANNIWHELSIPSFDLEVAYCQGERHVIRAIAKPLPEDASGSARWTITRGGTWVCTGGARGITAYVAEKLALKYNLKLHLIGTQPLPNIPESWRLLDEAGLRELKAGVMTSARASGKNPVTTWQDTEKAIEIDRNLQRFQQLGIEVHYHSCDVTKRTEVAATLAKVRQVSGPIHGVLHGAGIGKDARFDRKQSEKVNQCIGAKVDGAWSLMEATWSDPLEVFVGFGSISGRFGANGHTDYSLANDMLCKQMDWLRVARPSVHAIGFHWHAWGDIGMATKPETKLALEMIDMQFMPAEEGVQHLLRELDGQSEDSEVLITDDRYYRLFYEPELLVDSSGRSLAHLPPPTPLIETEPAHGSASQRVHVAQLNPAKDPFLTEHRLDDRPLLPIVIGTELMLEAARAHWGHMQPLKLRNVRAVQGLRCYTDAPLTVRLITSQLLDQSTIQCRLMSDFHARDGRLVDRDRVNMTGDVIIASERAPLTRVALPTQVQWQRPVYPAAGSKFYVGLPLQRLRGFTISDGGLVGRINAPALIELAGGRREVRGWQLPSSAVDACLFATGILAWQTVAPGSALPAGFEEIELGRTPWAGEACRVHVKLRDKAPGRAAFDFTLYGVNDDMLVNVRNYSIAWLTEAAAGQLASSRSVGHA